MRYFMGALAALCLVACGDNDSSGRLADLEGKAAAPGKMASDHSASDTPMWLDANTAIFSNIQPQPYGSEIALNGPFPDPIAASYVRQTEVIGQGLQALEDLRTRSLEAADRSQVAGHSDAASDAELARLTEEAVKGLQSNPITNGTLGNAIKEVLNALDMHAFLEEARAFESPDPAAAVRSELEPLLTLLASGANLVTTLTSVLFFDFVTESDGVVRTHRGILNLPIPLDVDGRIGPDVLATLSLLPQLDGSAALTLRVTRIIPNTSPFAGLLSQPLPLDIRARIRIPASNLTGEDDPNLRVDLGFVSTTDMPSSTDIELALNAGLSAGTDPAVMVDWNTRQPGSDLALVVDALRQNAATGAFEKVFGLSLANAPVPAQITFDLTLGELLEFAATSSAPTNTRISADVPGSLTANLDISSLPSTLNASFGNEDGGFVIQYLAATAIESLSAKVQLDAGQKLDLRLLDIPNQLNARLADPRSQDGRSINVNFGGQSIGEIAFTLVDGAVPRPVAQNTNGFILNALQGLSVGARLEGFTSLTAVLAESLDARVRIRSAKLLVIDLDLAGGTQLDLSMSNIPESLAAQLTTGQGFDAYFESSSLVNDLSLAARFGATRITSSLVPLPQRVDFCLATASSRCTGATAGSVVDTALSTSTPFQLTLNLCLSDCISGGGNTVTLNPLRAQNLALSIDIQDANRPLTTIPFGRGNFWLSTAGRPVEIDADARLGPASLSFDFLGSATNRRVRYDLGPLIPQFNRSGQISCDRFNFDLRVAGVNIGNLIQPGLRGLFCNG